MKNILFFLTESTFLLTLFYCSDEGLSPDQRAYIIPDKNISYYDDLLPMLEGKCGFECHSGSQQIVEIPFIRKEEFMDYQISVTLEVLVDTLLYKNFPEETALYKVITRYNYLGNNDIMPPFPRAPLTDNQINGIKQWIAEGAPD